MTIKVASVPCGSCPYRCDVPSGIWEQHEYDKLPSYDGPTWGQSPALFMCHQKAGWLACHDARELLALRFPHDVDPSVYDYATEVPVFNSGAEARRHGMRDISHPSAKAGKMITGLVRKRHATKKC